MVSGKPSTEHPPIVPPLPTRERQQILPQAKSFLDCWPCILSQKPDRDRAPIYRHLIPYPHPSAAMVVITQVPDYSDVRSRSGIPTLRSTYSARDLDALLKALGGIDFERSERRDIRYYSHALATSGPHSYRTSLLAPVRAVKSILVGERHPSNFFAMPMSKDQEEARDRLATVVHRRMAVLRLEGLGGSVRKLEDWYRDVVEVVGWRDAEEGELGWLWREDGGMF